MPHKCLPGGFLEPASPSSQLAQNMGCGPYPSPLSAVSLVLAAPGPAESRVHARAMAMPYPWTASWAPQATGMSQKSHRSGQHPNHLSQAATLITSNRKIFSDRVLIFSLENRWPPLQGPHTAFISLFPSILSSLCLSAQEHVVVTDTDTASAQIVALPPPRHLTLDSSLGLISLAFRGMIIIISASLIFHTN